MSQDISEIAEVFSIFHDGGFSGHMLEGDRLTLQVDCEYLAELIHPSFTQFSVLLKNVSRIDYRPWMEPHDLPLRNFEKPSEFITEYLEIISAEVVDGEVHISTHQADPDLDYSGGILCITASSIEVKSEGGTTIPLDELRATARSYWDSF